MTIAAVHAQVRPIRGWSLVAILVCSAAWSVNAFTVKESAGVVSAIGLGCARFFISATIFLGWAYASRASLRVAPTQRALVLLNGAMMFAQIALFNHGARATSTVHASLLISTFPIFSITIGVLTSTSERRAMSVSALGGLSAAVVGVVALILGRGDSGESSLGGDALVLLSAVIIGAKINFTKALLGRLLPVQALFWESSVASALFAACWWWTDGCAVGTPTPRGVAAILVQGAVISGLCFAAWTVVLAKHSSTHLAALRLSTPLFAAAVGWVFLGESVTPGAVMGGAMVIVGLAATIWARAPAQSADHARKQLP